MWFIGVEVEQETSAPPPKKNPGSAPAFFSKSTISMIESKFFKKIRFFGREEKKWLPRKVVFRRRSENRRQQIQLSS